MYFKSERTYTFKYINNILTIRIFLNFAKKKSIQKVSHDGFQSPPPPSFSGYTAVIIRVHFQTPSF